MHIIVFFSYEFTLIQLVFIPAFVSAYGWTQSVLEVFSFSVLCPKTIINASNPFTAARPIM